MVGQCNGHVYTVHMVNNLTLENQLFFPAIERQRWRKNCPYITPLLRSLHWLPLAACIRFKTLMIAYKAKKTNQPLTTWRHLSHSVLHNVLFKPLVWLDLTHHPSRYKERWWIEWTAESLAVFTKTEDLSLHQELKWALFFDLCVFFAAPISLYQGYSLIIFFDPDLVNWHEDIFIIETTKQYCKLLWIRASAEHCK